MSCRSSRSWRLRQYNNRDQHSYSVVFSAKHEKNKMSTFCATFLYPFVEVIAGILGKYVLVLRQGCLITTHSPSGRALIAPVLYPAAGPWILRLPHGYAPALKCLARIGASVCRGFFIAIGTVLSQTERTNIFVLLKRNGAEWLNLHEIRPFLWLPRPRR